MKGMITMHNCGKTKVLEIGGGVFGVGGASTLIWNLFRNIDPKKVSIDFCCYFKPEDQYIDEMHEYNSNCYVVKHSDNRLIKRTNEIRELRRIVKNQYYDCVHVHRDGAYNHLLYYWATKKYVGRYIVHGHNTSAGGNPVKERLHQILRRLLKGSGIIYLACSDDAAKWLFPSSVVENKQYTIIKNGIEIDKFIFDGRIRCAVREKLGVEKNFLIGHVGRFAYQKNHEFLIDTFYDVKRRCPNAILLLIGGDSGDGAVDRIREKVASMGLTDSVIFYGNTDKVNELYQAMDCFVLPSRYEGLGIVNIEAQAAGLKTLCSDAVPQEAKITELLEYMSLSDGPEKWAEKILTYANGYERKDMSKEITEAGYGIKESAKQLEKIYLRCCQENIEMN